MIRVIIADDHKLIREGLKSMLLEAGSEIALAGEAASGKELLALLEKREADLVLMDIEMPEMNGIQATRLIRKNFPRVKVLMLSMMENERFVLEATQAGAQGYVLKTSSSRELLHAVRTIAEGEEYFSTDIVKMLLRKMEAALHAPAATPGSLRPAGNGSAAAEPAPANISPRELEVLRLIARGHTNAQIGEMLFTSRRTVETHRQNLLEKTGTNNTATLILYAASHHLLE